MRLLRRLQLFPLLGLFVFNAIMGLDRYTLPLGLRIRQFIYINGTES